MHATPPTLPSRMRLPSQTLFGPGCLRHLWEEGTKFGSNGLLVHGQSLVHSGRFETLMRRVPHGLRIVPHLHEGGEPTLAQLDRLRSTARAARVDWVAAVGGGSVLDLGKAVAGLVLADGPSASYHGGSPLPSGAIPFLTAPSTAGTGSEATSVCVFTDERTGVKKSFRHPGLMARVVLLDPELLEDCPRDVIAASGMDALTQAVESAVSKHATAFTRSLSLFAVSLIGRSLLPAYEGHRALCGDLLQGSFLAGMALEQARLGLVHGFAHPLGARYRVGHGVACAACLSAVVRFNWEACEAGYREIGDRLGAPLDVFVADAQERMRMQNPFAGGLPEDPDGIVAEVLASGSTAANPRPVSAGDVRHVLQDIVQPAVGQE